MSRFSTVSSKGQLTVPQEIRKRLGLETGDRVEFVVEEGRTVIRPARSDVNPFEKYIGIDRKSTRLNSSHTVISYAVFCLKKKNRTHERCSNDTYKINALIRRKTFLPLTHLTVNRVDPLVAEAKSLTRLDRFLTCDAKPFT